MGNQKIRFRNLHLIVSGLLIFLIAIAYGFSIEKIVPALAEFKTDSKDMSNAFKAVMGMYFGLGLFWLAGVVRPNLWKGATLSNIFIMFGLASGRIVGFLMDGIPADAMIVGTVLELSLGFWGMLSYRNYKESI